MNGLAIPQRALRRLGRAPGFAAGVVGLLAIALAALLTFGSAAQALLWRDLPYPHGERLMVVQGFASQMQASIGFAPGLVPDVAALPGVEAVGTWDYAPDLYDAQGQRFRNVRIDGALGAMLGATPQLGRLLRDDDAADAAVLSDAAWRGRFGADPGIVGKRVDFDGTPVTVVGVMAPGWRFPERDTALWRALQLSPAQRSGPEAFGFGAVQVLLRLAPEAGIDGLRTALATRVATRTELESMRRFMGLELRATTLRAWWDGGRASMLVLLAGAGAALLLLLLANVGSLWLARCLDRARELSVSSALGASGARLAAEMACEVALLSALAVGLALLAVPPGLGALEALGVLDPDLPVAPRMDRGTLLLAFAAWLVLVAALSPGPVLLARRPQALALFGHGPRAGSSRAAQRARRALVALQVGLAVTLLCGAGLLTRSLWQLLDRDVGFEPEGASLVMVEGRARGEDVADARGEAMLATVRDRLAAVPGIEHVAVGNAPPFSFSESVASALLDDAARSDVRINQRVVGPDYFAALGTAPRLGRDFAAGDGTAGGGAVIVDQRFADLHFPGRDPIGQRLGQGGDGPTRWHVVVGVVPTLRHASLAEDAGHGTVYWHDEQPGLGSGRAILVVRSTLPGDVLARHAREAASAAGLRATDVASMPARLRQTLSDRVPMMAVSVAFAALGSLLAAVGLFALVAYAVQRRLPEFGVRLALGAPPRRLQALALREGLGAAVPGLLLGAAGAYAVGRVLAARLFDVSATDPATLAAVAAAALGLVLLACAGPARRAARLDPASTLRHD